MIRLTFLSSIIICFALSASAGECPELPEQPAISQQETEFKAAWKWFSEPYSVYDYAVSRDHAPLGVGHLKVEYTDHGYYDWPSKIILPLWNEPDGEFLAWIRSGLVLPADGAEVFPITNSQPSLSPKCRVIGSGYATRQEQMGSLGRIAATWILAKST